LEGEWGVGEARQGGRQVIPTDATEDGVVGVARIGDGEALVLDGDGGFAAYEVAIEFGRVAVLEASQLAGEQGVEGVGDHGQGDIEVHLDEDGRGERVEVEEFDGLADAVFDARPAGVVADEEFDGEVEVVGDQEGRFFAPVAAKDDLADVAGIGARQDNEGLMDEPVGVFSFFVRDGDAGPRAEVGHVGQLIFAAAAMCQELFS